MDDQLSLEQSLVQWELDLLQPEIRHSDAVARLLADDFIEFGSSGRVFTKADIIALLQAESPLKLAASQFETRMLAADVALLTYRVRRCSQPPVLSLRSSLWQKRGETWQMVFHQGTLIPG
ncbi:nuclear transport factor 2 family protein [Dyella flagellata]|uniref:DUF4440 domain-containing protein n=1 Tax=Dyella flagellata TaxID=1867833 RepID=A0ABQ5X9A4_9GAMM|nr:DUF4440 domain-containing protein [Dyella flagellata]GLQ87497.1 hypothetical protein GCM10007898_10630 [Dyella flagellata]